MAIKNFKIPLKTQNKIKILQNQQKPLKMNKTIQNRKTRIKSFQKQ